MRVAIMADIHGNLVALDAVFAAIAAQHADHTICLGDVAAAARERAWQETHLSPVLRHPAHTPRPRPAPAARVGLPPMLRQTPRRPPPGVRR